MNRAVTRLRGLIKMTESIDDLFDFKMQKLVVGALVMRVERSKIPAIRHCLKDAGVMLIYQRTSMKPLYITSRKPCPEEEL